MGELPVTHLQTDDLEEIGSVVTGIYCAHTVGTAGGARAEVACFDLVRREPQPIMQLHYRRSVWIDAGSFPWLMRDGSSEKNPSRVAAELGVSLRTLELGFRAILRRNRPRAMHEQA